MRSRITSVMLATAVMIVPLAVASAGDDDDCPHDQRRSSERYDRGDRPDRGDERRSEQRRQRYDDDDVRLNQLPQAVQETIQRETRGGQITEIDRDEDDGRVHYEVEFRRGDDRFEMHVARDGRVLLIERD